MTAERGYNGWANYPTWATALWLGNDPGTQADVERIAGRWEWESAGDQGGTLAELGDAIKSYVSDLPCIETVAAGASLASDLLGSALDAVDWREIAAASVDLDDAELERRRQQRLHRILDS